MLRVLFFARLREALGCASLEVNYGEHCRTLAGLERHLCEQGGDRWTRALGEHNLIRAVNRRVVDAGAALHEGDEVAFYPPVTGG